MVLQERKIRCGIRMGDTFFMGAFTIPWPIAWMKVDNSGISFGWKIFHYNVTYDLKFFQIERISKTRSFLFNCYRIYHNNEKLLNYIIISTIDAKIWDLFSKRQCITGSRCF